MVGLSLLALVGATEVHPGVSYTNTVTSGPQDIHVLSVDLCARGVALRATAAAEHQKTVSSWAGAVGVEAAINGDFFSYDTYYPIGMAMGAGSLWNADNSTFGFIAFGQDHADLRPEAEVWSSPADWMANVVGGYPLLVDEGVAGTSWSAPDHCPYENPRTAVGLSRDRQTLYLVVVDGRASDAAGMTCPELAAYMRDLGAWWALNLDGGGSSTLWVSGQGVKNDPSDGSERVVANHLGVYATGSGAAESCDFYQDELITDAGLLDQGPTDVNGDGRADLCARAAAGFTCYPVIDDGFDSPWAAVSSVSDDAGWGSPAYYATLRMADINGDGRADLCGRGTSGVRCWPSNGAGFDASFAGPEWSDALGWGDIAYYSTIRFLDLDGDGDDDVCARAAAGVRCFRSEGSSFGEELIGPELSDAAGWDEPEHYGTLRVGDLDGDGRDDLCARGGSGVWCFRSDGSSFASYGSLLPWSDAEGWDDVRSWSTIRMLDLDGDGRADLCGRGPDGLVCYRSNGSGFDAALTGPGISDATGWWEHNNYATLRFADLDADGDQDVCARANAGWMCWRYQDQSWGAGTSYGLLTDAEGWDDFRFYSTIRLADISGDGRADLCARGADGVSCWRGDDFVALVDGPSWADTVGWAGEPYTSTLRLGGALSDDSGTSDSGTSDSGTADSAPETSSDSASDLDSPGKATVIDGDPGCGCDGGGRGAGWPALLSLLYLVKLWRKSSLPS